MPNLPEHSPMPQPNITRTTLAVVFICSLLAAVLWIVRPFIAPVVWAALIVVASWPLMLRLEAKLGGRRKPAVAVMIFGLLLLLAVPIMVLALALLQNASDAIDAVTKMSPSVLAEPPHWLVSLPLIGAKIQSAWQAAITGGTQGLWTKAEPYAGKLSAWLIGEIGDIGSVLAEISMILFIAAMMYAKGEAATAALARIFQRLGGPSGEAMVVVSAKAIRSVALGVGLSASIEAMVAGAGIAIAGVPYAGMLTVIIFLCALVQIGPTLVFVPLIGWMFWSGATITGAFLVALFALVLAIDNLLGPLLIRKSIDLPTPLILAGVIGGLVAIGLMGIFVGPVVLAVAYTLLDLWVNGGEDLTDQPDAASSPNSVP